MIQSFQVLLTKKPGTPYDAALAHPAAALAGCLGVLKDLYEDLIKGRWLGGGGLNRYGKHTGILKRQGVLAARERGYLKERKKRPSDVFMAEDIALITQRRRDKTINKEEDWADTVSLMTPLQ